MNWVRIEEKCKQFKDKVKEIVGKLTDEPVIHSPRHRMSILLASSIFVVVMVVHTVANAQSDPSVEGQWSSVISWPNDAIHMHVLPTGMVMTWSVGDVPYIWDPDHPDTFTQASSPGWDAFCSGHSFLPDGGLFVTGGHLEGVSEVGAPNASAYDPWSDLWDPAPDMNAGRWYPTNTTLSNGDTLVVSGDISPGINNDLPQVFQQSTWSWHDLTNARLRRPLYPWMFLAPNGKVFESGPARTTYYVDTTKVGKWTKVARKQLRLFRDEGSSVMYDDGEVLVVGGGSPPTATAEVIDLNESSPAWRFAAPMSVPRRFHNVTLLPDGKVLVTGGNSKGSINDPTNAVYFAEMWDPLTEQFSPMASMTKYRLYHSTAALLPDGRVLTAGGNNNPTAEIYSPPYLFQGARPTIMSSPSSVTYGQEFFVETPDAANVARVTWIRLSSVTHAFNQNQRINRLSFSQAADGLNVTAPLESNLCPPGDYLLFILNGNGVPSVAKIINIQ